MFRPAAATTAALLLLVAAPAAVPQDLATRRANRVIHAQEKELLNRVTQRIEWDKQLAGSTLQLEAQPGGVMVLKGSVASDSAKARAVDLAESTSGVVSVVDELAVVRDVKVVPARAVAQPVVELGTPVPVAVPVPTESRLIVKP